jgi:hypothetical protein
MKRFERNPVLGRNGWCFSVAGGQAGSAVITEYGLGMGFDKPEMVRVFMVMKGKELKVSNKPDDLGPRILRTAEKVQQWSDAADHAERLLIKIRTELSLSRAAGDFHPAVVHHLRHIQSQVNRIREEIRWIETRVKETLVIEREWWKR